MILPTVPNVLPDDELVRLAADYVRISDGDSPDDAWRAAREAFKAAIAQNPMGVAIAIINRAARR